MSKSAIILAGGLSKRFGKDKALLKLSNKHLVEYIVDAINPIVDETLVVIHSKSHVGKYSKLLLNKTKILVDTLDLQNPLVGIITGCKEATGDYVVILPCDTPLVNREILSFMFKLSKNRSAVIPCWPNNYIEPLQAIYNRFEILKATVETLNKNETRLREMVDKLNNVKYLSINILKKIDPQLNTFLNINTITDLEKIKKILKN